MSATPNSTGKHRDEPPRMSFEATTKVDLCLRAEIFHERRTLPALHQAGCTFDGGNLNGILIRLILSIGKFTLTAGDKRIVNEDIP